MDRPVDPAVSRNRTLKRIGLSLVVGLMLLGVFAWGPGFVSPSLSRSRVRTGIVTIGPIEQTITAAGTVVPEYEQVLSSPVDARVVKILKRPGDVLRKGDPILTLDLTEALSQVKTLDDRLSIKENEQSQLRIDLENTLIGLKSQLEIKKLEAQSLQLQAEQNQKLRNEELLSDEELRRSEVERDKAFIEMRKLAESIGNAERSTGAQLQGREIEMNILRQEKQDTQRKLTLATTESDRDGVLTWVIPEVGSTVRRGELIARIADLRSFRVEATLSDIHATQLSAGLPARVRVNESYLDGTISSVLPTIKDGVMTVVIALKDKSHSLLRSNLRVDVYLVTSRKERALKIKRGPAVPGEGRHDVFVLRGDAVLKTPVEFGISSFDETEVISGLIDGDEVIISDMADHMHRREIRLR